MTRAEYGIIEKMLSEKLLIDLWYVVCTKCGATTDFKREQAEAIEAWNRRAE